MDYTKNLFKLDDYTSIAGVTLNGESKLSYINERAQLEEFKQDLECEKVGRAKAEKAKAELLQRVEELSEKLDEETYQRKLLNDQLVKRDGEIEKLQHEMEEMQNINEIQNINLKKKYQDGQNELTEQIDNLNMIRHRLEKEKHVLQREKDQFQLDLENVEKVKANLEKMNRSLETTVTELRRKFEAAQKEVMELVVVKNQLLKDNSELNNQISSNLNQADKVVKVRQSLTQQLDDARAAMEDMMKQSTRVYEENRRLTLQIKNLEDKLEVELENNTEARKQTGKLSTELANVRKKLEIIETKGSRSVEFEEVKKRLASRIAELERQLENVLSRCVGLEKVKASLQSEVEALKVELEMRLNQAAALEKKQKQQEKYTGDWKAREGDLEAQLEEIKKDLRTQVTENCRIRGEIEELKDSYDSLTKDNQNLSNELQDMVEQLSSNKKRSMEMEKMVKRLEMEKETMQGTIDDLESSHNEELNKYQRLLQDSNTSRLETERQLSEKDAELDCLRKTHQKSLDELQVCLDQENKSKIEVMRQKQAREQELAELADAIELTKQTNEDLNKHIRRLTNKVRELEKDLEEERFNCLQVERDKSSSDEKLSSHIVKIHELHLEIEALERANKSLHSEMQEISLKSEKLHELNVQLLTEKKVLETELQSLHSDLDDKASEMSVFTEQSKKAVDDASLLASELRKEQERTASLDRVSKNLENRLKEIQVKLHEAEATAMQGGHKVVQQLEERIHELEMELENEHHQHSETLKAMKRQERRLRELCIASQEGKSDQQKLYEALEKLQQKLRFYKRQVDELEESSKMNFSKYKKAEQEMEHVVERATLAEATLSNLRSRNTRSSSVAPFDIPDSGKTPRLNRASSEVKQASVFNL